MKVFFERLASGFEEKLYWPLVIFLPFLSLCALGSYFILADNARNWPTANATIHSLVSICVFTRSKTDREAPCGDNDRIQRLLADGWKQTDKKTDVTVIFTDQAGQQSVRSLMIGRFDMQPSLSVGQSIPIEYSRDHPAEFDFKGGQSQKSTGALETSAVTAAFAFVLIFWRIRRRKKRLEFEQKYGIESYARRPAGGRTIAQPRQSNSSKSKSSSPRKRSGRKRSAPADDAAP